MRKRQIQRAADIGHWRCRRLLRRRLHGVRLLLQGVDVVRLHRGDSIVARGPAQDGAEIAPVGDAVTHDGLADQRQLTRLHELQLLAAREIFGRLGVAAVSELNQNFIRREALFPCWRRQHASGRRRKAEDLTRAARRRRLLHDHGPARAMHAPRRRRLVFDDDGTTRRMDAARRRAVAL